MVHRHIEEFNPDVNSWMESHQDFLDEKINHFDAGAGYENFNDFLKRFFYMQFRKQSRFTKKMDLIL